MVSSDFPSLVEIKSKIPNHCFKAELSTSLYYVFRSIFLVLILFSFAFFFLSPNSKYYIDQDETRLSVWCLYWFLQGTVFWGIFVLGHDCGHSSFSKYGFINFIFGNLLHSFILVPYESWKITHRIHHKNTGNIDKDEVFYPQREQSLIGDYKRYLVITLPVAWMAYLYRAHHFLPTVDIFKKHRLAVCASILFWLLAVVCVGFSINSFGIMNVSLFYFIPLLVFMGWLVITTFLHHQDPDAIWYGNKEWTYVKGNLSSIDRSYGFIIDNMIHDIGTHQIHHLFPKIPHYKLVEATEVFRKEYPHLVRKSEERNILSFINNWINYIKHGVISKETQYFTYGDAIKVSKKLE